MKGVCLKFFAYEFQKHQGDLLYEWLLDLAKEQGIHGGSVFRGIVGFGRHGKKHEEHFFELASDVPIEIVFILTEEEAASFLALLSQKDLDLFYLLFPVEYGSLNGGKK